MIPERVRERRRKGRERMRRHRRVKQGNGKEHIAMANVRLHKDEVGLVTAMSTNATSEEDFLAEVHDVLQEELRVCVFEPFSNDRGLAANVDKFGFVLARSLKHVVEICCKLRGYKADVAEHRIILAGRMVPGDVVGAFEEVERVGQ